MRQIEISQTPSREPSSLSWPIKAAFVAKNKALTANRLARAVKVLTV
jgi:hypothetical protein